MLNFSLYDESSNEYHHRCFVAKPIVSRNSTLRRHRCSLNTKAIAKLGIVGGMLHPKMGVLLIENLCICFPVKLKGNNSVLDFCSMQVQ